MAESGPSTPYLVPALDRGLAILELIANQPGGLSVPRVAEALQLPRNSVYRLMTTLATLGYLRLDPDQATYHLTHRLLTLGYAATQVQGLVERSLDVLRALRDQTKETAFIATLVGGQGVILEQTPGLHPVKLIVEVGHRFPLHTGAPGKAMVAFLPEPERSELIRSLDYLKFNERTIDSPTRMAQACARIRELGYAVDHAEELEDVHCVAAPVLDHRGYPIAAIWVAGPGWRIPVEQFPELGAKVMRHARELSQRYGFKGLTLAS